jgi:hypothetical protein
MGDDRELCRPHALLKTAIQILAEQKVIPIYALPRLRHPGRVCLTFKLTLLAVLMQIKRSMLFQSQSWYSAVCLSQPIDSRCCLQRSTGRRKVIVLLENIEVSKDTLAASKRILISEYVDLDAIRESVRN